MEIFAYFVDITGRCNLRCPTCPHGQAAWRGQTPAQMSEPLFREVVRKIRREAPSPQTHLYLYNWGEATRHPGLPRFIEIARAEGLPPHLSSNLSHPLDLEAVVRARPQSLRISLSGLRPDTYGRTHFPGRIERVLENARLLRNLRERHRSEFPVEFFFHQYRDQGDDLNRLRVLAAELSFSVIAGWAFLMPLETLLAYDETGSAAGDSGGIARLLVDPRRALAISRRERAKFPDCRLRTHALAINADGTVGLCCATFDAAQSAPRPFLETPHAELQAWRREHPFCRRCRAAGADIYYAYGAQNQIEAELAAV